MLSFHDDILNRVRSNTNFRTVIQTGQYSQIVLMSIKPGEDIGDEVHADVDQVLVFLRGSGTAIVAGEQYPVKSEMLVHVPAGTRHNFINTGTEDLKLFTVYAPPEHADGTIHVTKADAVAASAAEHSS